MMTDNNFSSLKCSWSGFLYPSLFVQFFFSIGHVMTHQLVTVMSLFVSLKPTFWNYHHIVSTTGISSINMDDWLGNSHQWGAKANHKDFFIKILKILISQSMHNSAQIQHILAHIHVPTALSGWMYSFFGFFTLAKHLAQNKCSINTWGQSE